MIVGWLGLLLLVLIGGSGLIAFLARRRGTGAWFAPVRLRRRHIVTRVTCALLGLGILAALGAGTWRDVDRTYATEEAAEKVRLHLPTKPAPPLPEPEENQRRTAVQKARLLVHFIFEEKSFAGSRPVHAEEFEVRWPQDRGKEFERVCSAGGIRHEIAFVIHRIYCHRQAGRTKLEMGSRLDLSFASPESGHSMGCLSRSLPTERSLLTQGRYRAGTRRLLSVVPPRPGHYRCRIISSVRRIAEDDPLKEVSLTAYTREVGTLETDFPPASSFRPFRIDPDAPPTFKLFDHIGVSSLFLVAAAILLSQLFVRRGLGFAAILATCILYLAFLDRTVLATHISRLSDQGLSVQTRSLAAESLTTTFFYRRTALEAAEEAAKDPANPESLRRAARSVPKAF